MRCTMLILVFLLSGTLPCRPDEVRDLASKTTGVDIDAGQPLFAVAKRDIFLHSFLNGRIIICGGSASAVGQKEVISSIVNKNKLQQIGDLATAGINAGTSWTGKSAVTLAECRAFIERRKADRQGIVDSALQIRFTGDTSQLTSSVATAKQALAQYSPQASRRWRPATEFTDAVLLFRRRSFASETDFNKCTDCRGASPQR